MQVDTAKVSSKRIYNPPAGSLSTYAHRLDWAVHKYGTGTEQHRARGERTGSGYQRLHYMEVRGCQHWEMALRHGLEAMCVEPNVLSMATVIDERWHFPARHWHFDLEQITRLVRQAFADHSYLFLVEFAPITYLGYRIIAPHLQGLLWPMNRYQAADVSSHFSSGLAGAPALKRKRVYDLPGAMRYNVKVIDRGYTYGVTRLGKAIRRRRQLYLTEIYHLWRNLHHFTYPELTIASGIGEEVVQEALDRLDRMWGR